MKKTVYIYDQKSYEFMCSYDCQQDPMNPTEYITPLFSTEIAAPPVAAFEKQIFDPKNKVWKIVPDYRNFSYWLEDGSYNTITELNVSPPNGYLTSKPTSAYPITVSPWQIRQALNQLGLRKQVENLIKTTTNQDIIDGWEYATQWVENNPIVLQMAKELDLTPDQIHLIFVLASEK